MCLPKFVKGVGDFLNVLLHLRGLTHMLSSMKISWHWSILKEKNSLVEGTCFKERQHKTYQMRVLFERKVRWFYFLFQWLFFFFFFNWKWPLGKNCSDLCCSLTGAPVLFRAWVTVTLPAYVVGGYTYWLSRQLPSPWCYSAAWVMIYNPSQVSDRRTKRFPRTTYIAQDVTGET